MKYFAINYRRGKEIKKVVYEAETRSEARKKFLQESLGVMVSLKEVPAPLSLKWKKIEESFKNPIKKRPVPTEPYIAFLDQLSTMVNAGMPINTCLHQAIEDTKDPMVKAIFLDVVNDIESGQGLTKATARYKTQLGVLSLSMFDLGEQTGTLGDSLSKLSQILQQIHDNRQKLKKATRYPMFIIIAMMAAFSIVITYVVPQFESFFRTSNLELPFPTKMLLWIEAALSAYGLYILLGAVLVSGILGFLYSKSKNWHYHTDRLFLKVYIVGKVTYYAMIGRFIFLFEILTESGIPMLDALRISKGVVDNLYMNESLEKISNSIEEGQTLTEGFKQSEQFENMVIQMIRAGESSGSLGAMLNKINKLYQNRYTYIVENVATLIEPILIAAIAGFVMVLALGIFLPMWSMVDIAG